MNEIIMLKSYLKQDNVANRRHPPPHPTPTRHYLVWNRLQRKFSFVASFTIFKWPKTYYLLISLFNLVSALNWFMATFLYCSPYSFCTSYSYRIRKITKKINIVSMYLDQIILDLYKILYIKH